MSAKSGVAMTPGARARESADQCQEAVDRLVEMANEDFDYTGPSYEEKQRNAAQLAIAMGNLAIAGALYSLVELLDEKL